MKKLPKLIVLSLLTLTSLAGCDNGGGKDSSLSSKESSSLTTSSSSSSSASSSKASSSVDSSIESVVSSSSAESSDVSSNVSIDPISSDVSSSEDSSSSESSSSEEEKFKISLVKDAFVEAEFLVDGKAISLDDELNQGVEITMNLTFAKDYMLKDVPNFSLDCNVETLSEGVSYKFVMPKGNLTITLASKEVEKLYREVKSVDIISTNYIEKVEGISKGQDIKIGNIVEVELTAKYSSYTQLTYAIIVNGTTIKLEQDSTNTKLFKGSFEMPDEDIEVKATHIMKQAGEDDTFTTVQFESSDLYDIYGIENNAKYKCKVGTDYNYDSCRIKFYVIKKNLSTKITKVEWSVGESTSTTKISGSDNFYEIYLYNYTSSIANNTIHIKVTSEEVGTCKVSVDDLDKIDVDLTESEFTATEKLIITPTAKDGYYVVGLASITDGEGNDVTSIGDYYTSTNKVSISSLPKGSIVVKFKIVKGVEVQVNKGDYVESYKLEYNKTSYDWCESTYAIPGKQLRITPTLKSEVSGKIAKVYFNGQEMTSSYGGRYIIDVPEDLTTTPIITFEVAFARTITLKASDEFDIYSSPKGSAYKDEQISFKLREKTGYKIESVSLSNGTACEKGSSWNSEEFKFTMPDEDVEIKVVTKQVATHAVTKTLGEGVTCTFENKYGLTLTDDQLATINEGDELKGKLSFANGFKAKSVTFGDETVEVNSNKFTITVSKDATLKVETEEEEKHGLTINKENADLFDSVAVRDTNGGVDITGEDLKCYVGHKIRVTPSLSTAGKKDYQLLESSFSLKNSASEDIEFTYSSYSAYIEFTMPSDDVTLTITPSSYPTVNSFAGDNCNLLKVVEGSTYSFPSDSSSFISVPGNLKQGNKYTVFLDDPDYNSSKTYKLLVKDSSGKELKSSKFYSEHDWLSFDVGTLDVTISLTIE